MKTVSLLTHRTPTEWLLQQQPRLTQDVLTIVATSICLPAQLDWLWQREWIDLRSWDVGLLHRKELVPQVPEAVTEPRFPAPVRFVNHLLCALAALAFVLISIGNPNLAESQGSMSLGENLALIGPACIVICCFELARRLLRRTISETTFLRGAWMGWIAVLVLAAWVWHAGVVTPPVEVRAIPVAVFLLLFPVAMFRSGKRLAFWFPSPSSKHDRTSRNLTSKRNWRTFGWVCAYLMLWGGALGMY